MKKHDTEALVLVPTTLEHIHTLFVFQLDPEANYMAAFTAKNPADKAAYLEKWSRLLLDSTINNQTILYNNQIAGSVAKFEIDNEPEITYWIDKQFWGKGIATQALQLFLTIEKTRPLKARAAFDNVASQKVLEKCNFRRVGTDTGFANARNTEIEEFVYQLV